MTVATITYNEALEHLCQMFPTLERSVIERTLKAQSGAMELTVSHLLMLADPEHNEEPTLGEYAASIEAVSAANARPKAEEMITTGLAPAGLVAKTAKK